MNILWLSWKDPNHPEAGGAEVVLRELSRRLRDDGHRVTWLTCAYDGSGALEGPLLDGVEIIRVGRNRYLHSFQALMYYVHKLRNQFDIVIEVVNTAPYFGAFFGRKARRFLLYHQLAREIWFHELPPPLSYIGYYGLEPVATKLLSKADADVITVSESTRADLARYGFDPHRTHIISEGIEIEPLSSLDLVQVSPFDEMQGSADAPDREGWKFAQPTLLSFGTLRAMKRTLDQVEAFELAKKAIPNLQLKIGGGCGNLYGQNVLRRIAASPFIDDITYHGPVPTAEKMRLMQKSHLTMQTALKEGWGLTITEAASQGTPAVVYDADGLRDSVRHDQTGIIVPPNPRALADGIITMLTDQARYNRMRKAAWQWSKQINFDQSYRDFKKVLELA